jgi:hypothetical protein
MTTPAAQHLLAVRRPAPAVSTDPTDIRVGADRQGRVEADVSPVMGFTFVRKPVEEEIARSTPWPKNTKAWIAAASTASTRNWPVDETEGSRH